MRLVFYLLSGISKGTSVHLVEIATNPSFSVLYPYVAREMTLFD